MKRSGMIMVQNRAVKIITKNAICGSKKLIS